MSRTLILDTTAIYALATEPDRHFAQASTFWSEWIKAGNSATLTDTIFAESMMLLKSRHGSDVAISAGRTLRNPAIYQWVALTPDDETRTWDTFQRYADKDWSYVDCGLFVLARRMAAPIFSFDHHFDQMPEVQRVP